MIRRKKSPDGLPFRLYMRKGKFKVSFSYKLPDGTWAFWLSAPANDAEAIAATRAEAVERAEALNGKIAPTGETERLIEDYFTWQYRLPIDSETRKAENTLKENRREAKNLIKVFGKTSPKHIKPVHIYQYLDARATNGAPAKGNKEIALMSAIMEYARRRGIVETNPCRGIKYNKMRPREKYVPQTHIDFMMAVAREHGGSYVRVALCLQVAYLTVSRPEETRTLMRQNVTADGITVSVGKRKKGHAQRTKLIEWSPTLQAAVNEALNLQRTASMYVFGNNDGQPYSRSGFNTILGRLMTYCEEKAGRENASFTRFSLADMRAAAVTDRMKGGDATITDATGHADNRMVQKVYDRRKIRQAKPTK